MSDYEVPEEEYYEEDFPEPAAGGQKPKKKISPIMMAAAVLGGVAIIGGALYVFMPDTLSSLTAMIPGMGADPTPAPPMPVPHHHRPPVHPAAQTAEKPAGGTEAPAPKGGANDGWNDPTPVKQAKGHPAVAEKPAEKPAAPAPAKVAVVPHHHAAPMAVAKPVAAKPKPVAIAHAAPVHRSAASVPSAATEVGFARTSYWVSASEMEKLWSFSSRIKDGTGTLTVDGYAGNEGGRENAAELSRKRASRVAELLQKNNPTASFKINVKTHTGAGHAVKVTYSSAL